MALLKDVNRGEYRAILVTGPQRSGTTIASRMIGQDLMYGICDERTFDVSDFNHWRMLMQYAENVVIQCPTTFHLLKEVKRDVLVVVMMRDLEEIKRSERRIDWRYDEVESFHISGVKQPNSAKLKYEWWEENKRAIPHYYELQYGCKEMKRHPLWIQAEERKSFHDKQTK